MKKEKKESTKFVFGKIPEKYVAIPKEKYRFEFNQQLINVEQNILHGDSYCFVSENMIYELSSWEEKSTRKRRKLYDEFYQNEQLIEEQENAFFQEIPFYYDMIVSSIIMEGDKLPKFLKMPSNIQKEIEKDFKQYGEDVYVPSILPSIPLFRKTQAKYLQFADIYTENHITCKTYPLEEEGLLESGPGEYLIPVFIKKNTRKAFRGLAYPNLKECFKQTPNKKDEKKIIDIISYNFPDGTFL